MKNFLLYCVLPIAMFGLFMWAIVASAAIPGWEEPNVILLVPGNELTLRFEDDPSIIIRCGPKSIPDEPSEL